MSWQLGIEPIGDGHVSRHCPHVSVDVEYSEGWFNTPPGSFRAFGLYVFNPDQIWVEFKLKLNLVGIICIFKSLFGLKFILFSKFKIIILYKNFKFY